MEFRHNTMLLLCLSFHGLHAKFLMKEQRINRYTTPSSNMDHALIESTTSSTSSHSQFPSGGGRSRSKDRGVKLFTSGRGRGGQHPGQRHQTHGSSQRHNTSSVSSSMGSSIYSPPFNHKGVIGPSPATTCHLWNGTSHTYHSYLHHFDHAYDVSTLPDFFSYILVDKSID